MFRKIILALVTLVTLSNVANAIDRSFGDSLTTGIGATNPTTTGYIPQLATLLGTTFTNLAHGGDMVPDQTVKMLAVPTFAAGDRTIIMLGVNDQRIYGVNAMKQGFYRDGLRAMIGWASLANKQNARSVAGETGTWDNTGSQGIGRHTATIGSTKTFTVSGTAVYVAMVLGDAPAGIGTYNVAVDGISMGDFSANAPGIVSYNGRGYSERLHRFAGLAAGNHTIKVTHTGPSNSFVEWAAGNDQIVKPKVFVGNIIKASSSPGLGYAAWGGSSANVISYNADIAQLVTDFRSDGLDVNLVDVNSALNDTTDLHPADGLHPSQSGHDKLAATFYTAITGNQTTCPPGQVGTPPNCTTPPTFTFTNVPIYRRLNNGVPDGTFWIDDGAAQKQITVQ